MTKTGMVKMFFMVKRITCLDSVSRCTYSTSEPISRQIHNRTYTSYYVLQSIVSEPAPKKVFSRIYNYYFRYKPATEEKLLKAFQTLDVQSKGSFSVDFIKRALREGESFDEDEITEIIKTVYDPDHECILYNVWIHKLLVNLSLDFFLWLGHHFFIPCLLFATLRYTKININENTYKI